MPGACFFLKAILLCFFLHQSVVRWQQVFRAEGDSASGGRGRPSPAGEGVPLQPLPVLSLEAEDILTGRSSPNAGSRSRFRNVGWATRRSTRMESWPVHPSGLPGTLPSAQAHVRNCWVLQSDVRTSFSSSELHIMDYSPMSSSHSAASKGDWTQAADLPHLLQKVRCPPVQAKIVITELAFQSGPKAQSWLSLMCSSKSHRCIHFHLLMKDRGMSDLYTVLKSPEHTRSPFMKHFN